MKNSAEDTIASKSVSLVSEREELPLRKIQYFRFSPYTFSEKSYTDWNLLFGLGLMLLLILAIGYGFAKGYLDVFFTLILAGVVSILAILILIVWNWQE